MIIKPITLLGWRVDVPKNDLEIYDVNGRIWAPIKAQAQQLLEEHGIEGYFIFLKSSEDLKHITYVMEGLDG